MKQKKFRPKLSEDAFHRVLFAFALEFGWGHEYIRDMPYKIFKIYSKELDNYYREQEEASNGKKKTKKRQVYQPLTDEDKARRKEVIRNYRTGGV